jgi:ribonuclease HII
VPKGDLTAACVAAASVLAKVTRDRLMVELDGRYPQYGFAEHKGYCTPVHDAALTEHGPCPEHRFSFVNVASVARVGDRVALVQNGAAGEETEDADDVEFAATDEEVLVGDAGEDRVAGGVES